LIKSSIRVRGDTLGNLYYTDDVRIRKVAAGSRLVSSVVGDGYIGYNGENTAALATRLGELTALWVDTIGNVVSGESGRIRKFTVSTGLVATIAGSGFYDFADNLPATAAMFKTASDLVGDTNGNIYFTDYNSYRVLKITTSGILLTYAGDGTYCCYTVDNLPATSVQVSGPTGLQIDSSGNVYVSIYARIIKIDPNTALVTTAIGSGNYGNYGDGIPALSAYISDEENIWIDSNSHFYFPTLYLIYRIRKVASNIITNFAGTGYLSFAGDGGPSKDAQLNTPAGTFADTIGNVYISDSLNCRIRRVDPSEIISTFGGTGVCGGDARSLPFSATPLYYPHGIWMDSLGNLFVNENFLVRKVSTTDDTVTIIAGGGVNRAENILATTYSFASLWGIWGDTAGNLFLSDYAGYKVKMLTLSTSLIITVAGTGDSGFNDNVPAVEGQLSSPFGVWTDPFGVVFIADSGNSRIRKVENGFITTFAGTGSYSFNGDDQLATLTNFGFPGDVKGDSNGNIFVADAYNNRIRQIGAVSNIVSTVVGTGDDKVSKGLFPATSAQISYPQYLALDTNGAFYITEGNNVHTIRKMVLVSSPSGQPSRQPS
jgi:hypothetical protein